MPGPLSRAASGASYSGAFGSDAGDLSKAAAAFMAGRKQEEAARQQQAMQDALLALRQREADQGDARLNLDRDKMGEDRHQFDVNTGLTREKMGQDNNQFGQRLGFDRDKMGQDASEGAANRASAERIARIGAASRENVAGMRNTSNPRDWVVKEIQDPANPGQTVIVRANKQTGLAYRMKLDDTGNLTQTEMTPQEVQAISGQLGSAPTQAPQPVQGTDMSGPANQGEREAAASYSNLQTQFDKYKEILGHVGNQAPGWGTQFLMDRTKDSGFGPITSLTRSLSNIVLAKHDPDYQQVQQAVDALGTSVIKMVTGAQMSEPEAQRIMNILRLSSGDTPETVAQKLETVQNIINSERAKLGRMGGHTAAQRAPSAAPAPSAKSPADRWEELRAQGLSPDAATAQVKQEMGQ